MPTGEVELQVDELEIVSRSTPLPFQLDEEGVDETLRLRYRWLDLRRDKLQRNIRLRAQMVGDRSAATMEAAGFLDIQTPILFKPTPEGARDFVVPEPPAERAASSRCRRSPQILKQLCDDRRASTATTRSRSASGTRTSAPTASRRSRQLDVEMAFPDREDVLDADGADRRRAIWRECSGVEHRHGRFRA